MSKIFTLLKRCCPPLSHFYQTEITDCARASYVGDLYVDLAGKLSQISNYQ